MMLFQLKYVEEKPGYHYLSEKGRIAKKAGGHYAYLKLLKQEEDILRKKEERKIQVEELDWKVKHWTYRARYIPYIVSFLALIISSIGLYSSNKKNEEKNVIQQIPKALDTSRMNNDQLKD